MKTGIFLAWPIAALLLMLWAAGLHPVGQGPRPAPAEQASLRERRPPDRSEGEWRELAEALRADRPVAQAGSIHAGYRALAFEDDPDRRTKILESAVDSIALGDLERTLESLSRDFGRRAAELRPLLVRRWAEVNAAAAAAWIARHPRAPDSSPLIEQIAIAWANSDLPAATAWLHGLPENDGRVTAAFAIAYEAARDQPAAALTIANELPPSPERDDLLVHSIRQWGATDFVSACAWAVQISDSGLRQRMIAAVAIARAPEDGVSASTLLAAALPPGAEQDRAAISIVQRWVQDSPRAAAAWVARIPDVPLRDAALRHLLSQWTDQDAESAGVWLLALPAGSFRNAGVSAYLQFLPEGD